MAQIKNIKKPGDLIRGASVGLAGLDKDGNVVGTPGKAVPTPSQNDIGKILTVDSQKQIAWGTVAAATVVNINTFTVHIGADEITDVSIIGVCHRIGDSLIMSIRIGFSEEKSGYMSISVGSPLSATLEYTRMSRVNNEPVSVITANGNIETQITNERYISINGVFYL